MKAMILAAGLGSRLQPITNKLPKPLIDVGGISLIERSINQLISFGVSEIIINEKKFKIYSPSSILLWR